MTIAALSSVSSGALWILCDQNAETILTEQSWSDSESFSLSSQMGSQLELALSKTNRSLKDLTQIFCVTGPGSFTGLRTSASYCLGLSRALNIPNYGISSFECIGEKFAIPLQHQKFKELSLNEAKKKEIEFLVVDGKKFQVSKDIGDVKVLGLKENPYWPTAIQLQIAIQKKLQLNELSQIEISYGFEPKYF